MSKQLDDCYFYYYSTCFKGEDCPFRHEENALGCETVCSQWKDGKCMNRRCQFRHMLLKKNRKAIQCFWESQPGGCRKQHCPFLHKKDKLPDNNSQDSANVSSGVSQMTSANISKNIAVEPNQSTNITYPLRRPSSTLSDKELNYASPPVDPLVVKFEEESDNELDIPSPCKFTPSGVGTSKTKSWVKTLEEIRLERIQKLSAAFYSFTGGADEEDNDDDDDEMMMNVVNEAMVRGGEKSAIKSTSHSVVQPTRKRKLSADNLGFRVLTLEEIRQKRQKKNRIQEPDSTSESDHLGLSAMTSSPMMVVDEKPTTPRASIDALSGDLVTEPVDITSFSEKVTQNLSQPSTSRSDIDVSQKKKPIRLKRSMKRDEDDQVSSVEGHRSSKCSKDENVSLTHRSAVDSLDQASILSDNSSEVASNPGEMDTVDILNGIDELLGN